jgi:deazaflavin-dependent oxidoreductase (nitroreductase family)
MPESDNGSSLPARLASIARKSTTKLTHVGRKSGKPYQVTIWFTVDGDHINLQTMNMNRQWIKNVLANPNVTLRIGDQVFDGVAQKVTDPQDMQRIVALAKRKYPISLPYFWLMKQPDGAFRVTLQR